MIYLKTDEEIEKMAESCFMACGEKASGSAKLLCKEDMMEIYKMAK